MAEPAAAPRSSIFICYRRQDSADSVDRINDELNKVFGPEAVYRDVTSVPAGVDFQEHVAHAIAGAIVVLVVIGPSWLDALEHGHRRLENPDDHVRLEIETALRIPNLLIIPVFIRDMKMPDAGDLPESLRPMTLRNGKQVRPSPNFSGDISQLIADIREGLEIAQARQSERSAKAQRAAAELAQAAERPITALDEGDWSLLLSALASGTLAVILGPELGAVDVAGVVASPSHHLARAVADTLQLPPPPPDEERPLRRVAMQFEQSGGGRTTFNQALFTASLTFESGPTDPLMALAKIDALRFVATTAVDTSVDTAFQAARKPSGVRSYAYGPQTRPFEFEPPDERGETIVARVAGDIRVVPNAAITDADWFRWSEALHTGRWGFRELVESLGEHSLLMVGGGHPLGFVELLIHFWKPRRLQKSAQRAWLGASVLAGDPSRVEWIRTNSADVRVFDDGGGDGFVVDLARRWVFQDAAAPAIDPPPLAPEPFEERRWPGPGPLTTEAAVSFHGREHETAEIIRALRTEALTLLFASCGVGKTSFIQAGLVPRLSDHRCLPIYVPLRYAPDLRLMSLLASAFPADLIENADEVGSISPDSTLWGHFRRRTRVYRDRRGPLTPVLILDQFEELLARNKATAARLALEDIADLVENRPPAGLSAAMQVNPSILDDYDLDSQPVRILLSVREDYLPEIQSLTEQMPSIFRNSFRLLAFSREQALQVVMRTSPGLVTAAAAAQIVDALAGVEGARRLASRHSSHRIDPTMLGLMLRELDRERRDRGLDRIDESLLQSYAPDAVLDRLVEGWLADLPPQVGSFIERQLTTPANLRDSVSYEQTARELAEIGGGLDEIDTLVQRGLLRETLHRGSRRVELAHDVLVRPIVRWSRRS